MQMMKFRKKDSATESDQSKKSPNKILKNLKSGLKFIKDKTVSNVKKISGNIKVKKKTSNNTNNTSNIRFKDVKKELKIHRSIAVGLIISFIVPVIFSIAIGVISYSMAYKSIVDKYTQSNLQTIFMTSEYFRLGFTSIEAAATQYTADTTIANYVDGKVDAKDILSAKLNMKKELLAKTMSDEFVSNIHIIARKADTVTTAFKSAPGMYRGYNDSKKAKELSGKTINWYGGDEYLDEKLDLNSKKYACRYKKGFGTVDATCFIDVKTSAVKKELDSNNFGDGSIVGFITVDGKEIYSTNSKVDKKTTQLFSKEKFFQTSYKSDVNKDHANVKYNGTRYLYLYSKIGTTGTIICALIPQKEIINQVSGIKNVTILLVAMSCIIAIIIGSVISSGIQNTIRYFIKELKAVAGGNLTVNLSVKRKDEFLALSNGINDMIDKMRGLIDKVKVQSESVTRSSDQVMNASNIFTDSTQGIFESIKEIQTGVAQQAEDAGNCLVQMDNLSEKIQVVGGKTKEISDIASETKDSVSAGMDSMGTLNQKANETAKITEDIITHIEELEEKSKSIGKIVSTINDIANQTTLLSLNASIEAARAGVYGRGFSVVAEEIGKLSEQSVRAVKNIEGLIKEIQAQTKNTVVIANKADKVVADQEEAVKNTEQSFQKLYGNVERLIDNVGMITESIDNIDAARVGTLQAIENISAVSQQTAAEAVTVYNSTNEQIEVVQSLSNLSKELEDNAQALDSVVHQFKLS